MGAINIALFGAPAHFYECPRWRNDRWWVSDMRGHAVHSFSAGGEPRLEFEFGERLGGLGWTRDGDLLVVAMDSMSLLQVAPGGRRRKTIELAPLVKGVPGFLNDMAVSPAGHAYIGFDAEADLTGKASKGRILHVAPNGATRVAADNLAMPNGIVFSPDGASVIAAETMSARLTSFQVSGDGSLGPATLWGSLDPRRDGRSDTARPIDNGPARLDGCAMDAEGCIWAADVFNGFIRIAPGGEIVGAVFPPDGLGAIACALGGVDGRTLLLCCADGNYKDRESRKDAKLFTATVAIPAA